MRSVSNKNTGDKAVRQKRKAKSGNIGLEEKINEARKVYKLLKNPELLK